MEISCSKIFPTRKPTESRSGDDGAMLIKIKRERERQYRVLGKAKLWGKSLTSLLFALGRVKRNLDGLAHGQSDSQSAEKSLKFFLSVDQRNGKKEKRGTRGLCYVQGTCCSVNPILVDSSWQQRRRQGNALTASASDFPSRRENTILLKKERFLHDGGTVFHHLWNSPLESIFDEKFKIKINGGTEFSRIEILLEANHTGMFSLILECFPDRRLS